jgi:lysophospholipase L1-like esterase
MVLTGCGSGTVSENVTSTPTAKPSIWVGAWGASMTNAEPVGDNIGGTDRSFRFLVTSTIDGARERVKFSNVYGTTAVTIGAARLSAAQEGSPAIDPSHDVSLLFNGQKSITIAPGQDVTSDPVNLSLALGQVLAVSINLKGTFGPVSRHDSYFITNYTTADGAGDKTADASGTSYTATLGDWLLINEIDVYGQYQGTLAMFGSSTTDGFKSDYGSDQVYPVPNVPLPHQHADRISDLIARRLNALGYHIGVLNAGIPYDTVTDNSNTATPHTLSANERIAHDVLALPNLIGMVTYFGSIDLRSSDCRDAVDMEAATQRMIQTAHAANVPVVMVTLPPTALCQNPSQPNYGPSPSAADPYAGGMQPGPPNGAEVQRILFNDWVRSTGVSLPGVAGIADYDKALSDPQHPSFMLPLYNSGDNFHMNGAGYQAESDAIPLMMLPVPSR